MAASKFNFQEFARDQQVTAWVSGLADIVSEALPEEQKELIKNYKKQFKLETESDPKPDFRFNLSKLTYEKVLRNCRRNNRNIKRCTYIQGDRFFVERRYREDGNQTFREVAWPASVDVSQEVAQLTFLDTAKKHVDWPTTLNNLNRMITDKPYSEKMMKTCLLRFINHYESAQTEYLKNKSCNKIANFLLLLNSRIDRIAFHKARLMTSVRSPAETLSAAIYKIKNIAEHIYPKEVDPNDDESDDSDDENEDDDDGENDDQGDHDQAGVEDDSDSDEDNDKVSSSVNRILINGIISFLRDELAVPLMEKIQQDTAINKLQDYNEYLKLAMNAELRTQMYPTVPLKYGRKLPGNTGFTLNTMEFPKIHPCQQIPARRGVNPKDWANYFGFTPQSEEAPLRNHGDRIGRANRDIIPYDLENQDIPALENELLNPMMQGIGLIGQHAGPRDPFAGLPGFGDEANQWSQWAPKLTIKKKDIPKGVTPVPSVDGSFLFINGQKYYVDNDSNGSTSSSEKSGPSNASTKTITSDTEKSDSGNRSENGKDPKDPKEPNGSNGSDKEKEEPVYAEIHLMATLFKDLLQATKEKLPENNKEKPSSRSNSQGRKTPPRKNSSERKDNGNANIQNSSQRQGYGNSYPNNRPNSPGNSYYNQGNNYNNGNQGNNYPRGNSPYGNNYRRSDSFEKGRSYYNNYSGQGQNSQYRNSYSPGRYYNGNGNSGGNYSQERGRPEHRSNHPNEQGRKDISRERSLEAKKAEQRESNTVIQYPRMKKGINCRPYYNPYVSKSCTKCKNEFSHHEFECRIYEEWSENRCGICDKYYHLAKYCKEVQRFPPKTADSNSIELNPN